MILNKLLTSVAKTTVRSIASDSVPNVSSFFKTLRIIKNKFNKTFKQKKGVWKLGKLNHVAIAVPNMQNAINLYKNVLNADNVSEMTVS